MIRTIENGSQYDTANVVSLTDVLEDDPQSLIGAQGFFGDSLRILDEQVALNRVRTVSEVDSTARTDSVFRCVREDGPAVWYGLFLPQDKVKLKKPEQKYRPFKTLDELYRTLHSFLGDVIVWRYINTKDLIFKGTITGLIENYEGELKYVCLAGIRWGTEQLFEQMEWRGTNGEWHPFGTRE
jgi:hypothetical protein